MKLLTASIAGVTLALGAPSATDANGDTVPIRRDDEGSVVVQSGPGAFRADVTSTPVPAPSDPLLPLTVGSNNPAVAVLQQRLGIAVDCDFGNQTAGAVADWQAQRGAPVTEQVAAADWEALDVPLVWGVDANADGVIVPSEVDIGCVDPVFPPEPPPVLTAAPDEVTQWVAGFMSAPAQDALDPAIVADGSPAWNYLEGIALIREYATGLVDSCESWVATDGRVTSVGVPQADCPELTAFLVDEEGRLSGLSRIGPGGTSPVPISESVHALGEDHQVAVGTVAVHSVRTFDGVVVVLLDVTATGDTPLLAYCDALVLDGRQHQTAWGDEVFPGARGLIFAGQWEVDAVVVEGATATAHCTAGTTEGQIWSEFQVTIPITSRASGGQ